MKDKKIEECSELYVGMLQRESDGEYFLGIKLGSEEIIVDADTAEEIFDRIGDFLEMAGRLNDEEEMSCTVH